MSINKGTVINVEQLSKVVGTIYRVKTDNLGASLSLQPVKEENLSRYLVTYRFTDANIQLTDYGYWIEARSRNYGTLLAVLLKRPENKSMLIEDLKATNPHHNKNIRIEQ